MRCSRNRTSQDWLTESKNERTSASKMKFKRIIGVQSQRPQTRLNGILVASPDYLAKRGTPQRPDDLKPHAVIVHTALMPNREWRYVEGGKAARIPVRPRIEINDAHAGIQLAEQGHGITIVLSYMVTDALRAGRLVPVLNDFAPPPVPVHLIYAQRLIIAPKVRAFIDFATPRLRAALADLGTTAGRRAGTKPIRK